MALKLKIKKADYDKLGEVLQKLYVAGEGDEYVLDAEGGEDTGALRRAKDREKGRADTLQTKIEELQAQLDEISTNTAKKSGDIKTLETQWQTKLNEQKTALETKISKQTSYISNLLIGNESLTIAAKISTAPTIMQKLIKERLTVDFTGDEPKVIVLDDKGNPSSMTMENLTEEFVANKDLKSIITASKASGGAGSGDKGNPRSGAAKPSQEQEQLLSKVSAADLVAHINSKKQ